MFAGIISALSLPAQFYLFGSAVPVTLQTLGVMLAGLVLGARLGALAVLVYLAIGAVGVPVFGTRGSFADAIADKKSTVIPPQEIINGVAVLEAIEPSAKKGKAIKIQ